MLDIPLVDDRNKQEEGDEENDTDDKEKSDGIHEAVQTSDAAKKLNAPLTGNNASLSLEELEELKWSKSAEYLKAIISVRGSLNDKCSSFLTMSGGRSKSESANNLLTKIKEKAFDVDLLQVP